MVNDIYSSIANSGLTALVILNCHGGNYVLANIVQEGNAQGKRMALFPSGEDWAEARRSAELVTSGHEDMHAGELETSILLHANPELVRDGYQSADWVADDRRHLLTTGMSEYTRSGVIGRPSLASAEKGKALLASWSPASHPCWRSCAWKFSAKLVGLAGFEPATSATQTRRASQTALQPVPTRV